LEGTTFKDEFAHTILHNQNVFEEFRKVQIALKEKAAQEKKEKELQEAQKQLQALNLNY
jgi:cell fate (sporulation/competence/biofilm development) regulator YlbF (YheA/YmcA/DUF963 family)